MQNSRQHDAWHHPRLTHEGHEQHQALAQLNRQIALAAMIKRTTIVLDDELVAQAMMLARVKTKKAAVEAPLRAYVQKPDYSRLLALQGQDLIDPEYDPRGPYCLSQAGLERRGLNGAS